jgi:hypothetical protein
MYRTKTKSKALGDSRHFLWRRLGYYIGRPILSTSIFHFDMVVVCMAGETGTASATYLSTEM